MSRNVGGKKTKSHLRDVCRLFGELVTASTVSNGVKRFAQPYRRRNKNIPAHQRERFQRRNDAGKITRKITRLSRTRSLQTPLARFPAISDSNPSENSAVYLTL